MVDSPIRFEFVLDDKLAVEDQTDSIRSVRLPRSNDPSDVGMRAVVTNDGTKTVRVENAWVVFPGQTFGFEYKDIGTDDYPVLIWILISKESRR